MRPPQTTGEIPFTGAGHGYRGLSEPWIKALRPLWVIAAIFSLALFAAGIPDRYEQVFVAANINTQVLADMGMTPVFLATYFSTLDIVLALAHFLIAFLIFWEVRDSLMAVMVALALVTTPMAATEAFAGTMPPWKLLADFIVYLGLVSSMTLLYLFPDGFFVPRWTRPLTILWAGLNIPAVFLALTNFGLLAWWRAIQVLLLLAISGSGIYAQIHRYIRISNSLERQQTKWAILGLAAAALAPLAYYLDLLSLPSLSQVSPPTLFYNLADPAVFKFATAIQLIIPALITLALLLFPISFAVATLRYHLFDIEIVLNRTMVYGALTALIIILYIVIVGGLGALLQAQDSVILGIFATGLIAVLFDPLRSRLQVAVNRLMYGERDDPIAVLSQLGQRLEQTGTPEMTLTVIVESIQQSLKLPYVGIALNNGEKFQIAAEAGSKQGAPLEVPLTYQGEKIGLLIVTARSSGELFSQVEKRLFENISHQAAQAVHAVRLTTDLQRSREKLVAAREEERRRLRRDLHDGLGPQLAILNLKIDTVRNLLPRDPEKADQLLLELKEQSKTTIGDIRRLVNDLRPSALDQLGLVSALEEQAVRNRADGMHFRIDAPEKMPSLPAAVEVAAYRIALEAMTNVVRHAGAQNCLVRLRIERAPTEDLKLEIIDDGHGLPDPPESGVGLLSMRERAAELGGLCLIESLANGGTRVWATLTIIHEG